MKQQITNLKDFDINFPETSRPLKNGNKNFPGGVGTMVCDSLIQQQRDFIRIPNSIPQLYMTTEYMAP